MVGALKQENGFLMADDCMKCEMLANSSFSQFFL